MYFFVLLTKFCHGCPCPADEDGGNERQPDFMEVKEEPDSDMEGNPTQKFFRFQSRSDLIYGSVIYAQDMYVLHVNDSMITE